MKKKKDVSPSKKASRNSQNSEVERIGEDVETSKKKKKTSRLGIGVVIQGIGSLLRKTRLSI